MAEPSREVNKLAKINNRIDKLEKTIHRSKHGQTSNNFLEALIGKKIKINYPDVGNREFGTNVHVGDLIAFDEFTLIVVLLETENHHLIFKHAIESICEA